MGPARSSWPPYSHTERQRRGLTLVLLYLEYLGSTPTATGYTQFCEYYRRWCRRQRLSMRQIHRAGEKLLVDYTSQKPTLVDLETGEKTGVEPWEGPMKVPRCFGAASEEDLAPARKGLHRLYAHEPHERISS